MEEVLVSTKDIMTKFLIDSGLFVDDYKVVFFVLPAGSRWDEEKRKMVIHEDKIEEDRQRRQDDGRYDKDGEFNNINHQVDQ